MFNFFVSQQQCDQLENGNKNHNPSKVIDKYAK